MNIDYEWEIDDEDFIVYVFDYEGEDYEIEADLEEVDAWINKTGSDYKDAAENLINQYIFVICNCEYVLNSSIQIDIQFILPNFT